MPRESTVRSRSLPRLESLNLGVYERLKVMISNGELRPGARLVQQALAKELGTSPTPVIEALRRLERDGLVMHVPHLGSFVRESTIEDLRELFCLRRAIECEACLLFVERATELETRQLVALDNVVNAAAAAGDLQSFMDADMSFHLHIVAASKATRLREILDKGQVEERIFMAAPEWQSSRGTQYLQGVHKHIVDAITRRDGQASADAMRQHLLQAEKEYVEAAENLPRR